MLFNLLKPKDNTESMEQYLLDFIKSERNKFINYDNSRFTNSFNTVVRYYKFLYITNSEYQKLVSEYSKTFFNLQKTTNKEPGPYNLTNKQIELYKLMNDFGVRIQLKIETYYQFAKILLDKIAFCIELYFGFQETSHHKLIKNCKNTNKFKIENYCQIKGLKINQKLLNKMICLQEDISEFRDKKITHCNCPRILYGVDIEGKMILSKMYPKNKDEETMKISKKLNELKKEIDEYIEEVISFIDENTDKTNLSLKKI